MSTKIEWAEETWNPMRRFGKKAAGDTLDGQQWHQVPEVLR